MNAHGRVSVPAEILRKLGVGPGSVLEWAEEGGRVVVRRATGYSSEDIHRAVFAHPPKPRSSAELKEGIADSMRKKHGRR